MKRSTTSAPRKTRCATGPPPPTPASTHGDRTRLALAPQPRVPRRRSW
jgi:hypothetical protein